MELFEALVSSIQAWSPPITAHLSATTQLLVSWVLVTVPSWLYSSSCVRTPGYSRLQVTLNSCSCFHLM